MRDPSVVMLAAVNAAEHRAWVWADMDRSPLASFAVDYGWLTAAHAWHGMRARLWAAGKPVTDVTRALEENYDREAGMYRSAIEGMRNKELANAELFFWWRNGMANKTLVNYTYIHNSDFIEARIAQLQLLTDHPEMIPYFAMDIWDGEFIAHCMAEGIDTALAAETFHA